jgi:putative transposase
MDDFSQECLAAVVDTMLSGERVARELYKISDMRGCTCKVVRDNGIEITLNVILKWQGYCKVDWDFIETGNQFKIGLLKASIAV